MNGATNAKFLPRFADTAQRITTETIVKKFLLAAAFTSAFAAGAIAQNANLPPRDPPFGKAPLTNDTVQEPAPATTRGVATTDDATKSEKPQNTRTKSAKKKNNTKKDAAKDTAPKTDTN